MSKKMNASKWCRITAFGLAVCAVAWLIAGCKSAPKFAAQTQGSEPALAGRFDSGTAAVEKSVVPMMPYERPGLQGGTSPRRASPMLLSSEDEVWVIARGSQSSTQSEDQAAGSGMLMAKVEQKEVPMPLRHTEVRASISGYIGAVEVNQQFQNPYSSKIEAVYVFPLPHNAAVNEFVMVIGERKIRGIIRERKEAEEIYQEAKRQGYVASLLTEERPNVFSQSVANIEPGKAIDVKIKYINTLEYVDGWYEFHFPMVVGPRFNPPGYSNGVGAVARGKSGASGQPSEVHYLSPNERTGHDIGLKVEVDAGAPIEEFECKTHKVSCEKSRPDHLTVSLNSEDKIPNRDFVLRYRLAGERVKSSLITSHDERGNYFTFILYPPRELEALPRQPLEMVFVLDCSGSMNGRPIAQAQAAVARGLRLLQPGDSFQLITFSMKASQLGEGPLEAAPENIQHGLDYLQNLEGEGGTMMIEGIKAALEFPHDPQRLRFVCFLTDGYIGNEGEILTEIHKRLGSARIFSFGIGSAVNRYLIDQMGKVGHGAVAYLGPRDEASKIMEDFFNRISQPALMDVRINWGSMNVEEVFPRKIPDLFVGRPVILTGRFTGDQNSPIGVTGNLAGERVPNIPVDEPGVSETHLGLPSVWARAKIADLTEEAIYEPGERWPDQIKKVALDYGLMSPFTAFIAVDSSQRTEGTEGTTVPVAVPVPEGVKYETTVKEE